MMNFAPKTDQEAVQEFFKIFDTVLQNNTFQKLTLSKFTDKAMGLKNIFIKRIILKEKAQLNFLMRYTTRDETKNFSFSEAKGLLEMGLGNDYLNADLFTTNQQHTLVFNKKRKAKLYTKTLAQTLSIDTTHDKEKQYLVPANRPYLKALQITSSKDKVFQAAQKKYRQINRYVEVLAKHLEKLPNKEQLRIVDMGSGKGYLTFALYDYLNHTLNKKTQITGIELRENLVKICTEIAQNVGFEQLDFEAKDIFDYETGPLDMLVALHACDIATDIAIAKGIQSKAQLIVVAPCCHKQVRKAMQPQLEAAKTIAQYGILQERQAELLTDSIRALLLESKGYKTKVFEFISSEHTGKNLMIIGAYTGKPKASALEEVDALKKAFGISQHYLESLI